MQWTQSAVIGFSLLMAFVLLTAGCGQPSSPGDDSPSAGEGTANPVDAPATDTPSLVDVSYVPDDACAAVVIDLARITHSRLLEPLASERILARAMEQGGFDRLAQSQLLILASKDALTTTDPDGGMSLIVRFSETSTEEQVLAAATKLAPALGVSGQWIDRDDEGRRYLKGDDMSFCVPDCRTLLVGSESSLQRMLDAGGATSGLIDRLRATTTTADVIAIADLAAAPEMADALAGASAAPGVADQLSAIRAHIDLDDEQLLSIVVETKTEQAAGDLEAGLRWIRGPLRKLIVSVMDHPEYFDRSSLPVTIITAGEQMLNGLEFSHRERVVRVELRKTPVIERSLQKALKEIRHEMIVRHMIQRVNQVQDALVGYMRAESKLPPADRKSGLSWRVELLPYLGEAELYSQFHTDEPWDSEHNIQLLDRMPAVFLAPGVEDETTTPIMAFTGPGTLFPPGKPRRLTEISDGLSRTLLAVWTGPDKAVPWTKPVDLLFNPDDPVPALGKIPEYGAIVVSCDGRAGMYSGLHPDDLRALITPDGGETFPK